MVDWQIAEGARRGPDLEREQWEQIKREKQQNDDWHGEASLCGNRAAITVREVAATLGITDQKTAEDIVDDLRLLVELLSAGELDRADAAATVDGVVQRA